MDLKLVFYVLSLILLVAYGADARKIVEGNIQGKRLNFPLAQVHLSSNGDLQNNQGYNYDHQQANTENAQVSNIFWYGDLQNKDDTKTKNAQVSNIFWYDDLQNKDDAKTENAQVSNMFWYGDLQNKDDTKTENAQVSNILWYGDLQNKDDTKTENGQVSSLLWYGDLQNKDDAKIENAIFWYDDLQSKDDTQTSWIHNKEGENKHKQAKTENAHIHSSDHVDPSVRVFFLLDDLKVSREISVSFPRRASNFLPKDEADSIPFSRKELPNLLQRFAISRNSPQAKTMEETLRVCEFPPIKGETKYCAASPEAMLNFVQGIMGEKTQIKALSTTHSSNSTPLLQKYTILDAPREVETPKMVACHTMPYAYAIFYCHYTVSKSKVFKVSLRGENGDRVEAIAVCHLDTSDWSPSHISFRLLGVLPGTSPVCHFFPSGHLVWVSKITNARVI